MFTYILPYFTIKNKQMYHTWMVREWFTIPPKKRPCFRTTGFPCFFFGGGVGWVDRWTSRKKNSGRRSWGATNALSQAVCGLASWNFRLRVDGCKICRKTDESWGFLLEKMMLTCICYKCYLYITGCLCILGTEYECVWKLSGILLKEMTEPPSFSHFWCLPFTRRIITCVRPQCDSLLITCHIMWPDQHFGCKDHGFASQGSR